MIKNLLTFAVLGGALTGLALAQAPAAAPAAGVASRAAAPNMSRRLTPAPLDLFLVPTDFPFLMTIADQ